MLEHYRLELLNFLARQVNNRDNAADLVQESFVRVLAVLRSGQAVLNPRALLYRTARNLVTDQHRRLQVRQHDELELLDAQALAAPAHLEPDAVLASRQVVEAYARAIESLPPRCREAFVLHVLDGMSQREVAARMGISTSMVEKHVVRGMLACRQVERALGATPLAEA
ncbi:RNA polymerase subunit sigma [Massilia sp. KIM]|uniref:sigma-70 family RNA polymerase sigma factor n=1 Tax=Massilia sp. KIM TaxID=1955422 RepID=UPI0009903293|nr:sigma-70 family RNA polymerase sigma factor [Massilia sp. KIM]OON59952.1 RNA polymerase subunit sigma [Massilia sp. KIM]